VTRPEPGAGETAARLTALGFLPVLAPVLAIVPRMLADVGRPQAALVTSGNALPALPVSLHARPLLAVGDATAARARAAGFACVLSAGRDAAALADLAASTLAPANGTLLLASGEGQGSVLVAALRARGFSVRRRVTYAARPATALPVAARDALRAGTILAALFFSPRSARLFATLLQRDMRAADVHGIEALAISSATEAALRPLPWRRVRVASQPTQEGLLTLLQ
jgi:uroporphyrinogen-III synthase